MRNLSLATDLYQFTMAAAYHASGNRSVATFEMFVREIPPNRAFLVCAGLAQTLDFLESFSFSDNEIEFLAAVPALRSQPNGFFEHLRRLRFTGDVWAMPEGTVFLPGEPILRVTAPIIEAQLIETAILATVNFQTMIASKAARVALAAQGRPVAEFGGRRAHGTEAAMLAARAAYIGGCSSTSNMEAGKQFGIPLSGTMAHSYVMAFDDELDAFRTYMETLPENATLLLDTYDTIAATRKVADSGLRPATVRLDSGDLDGLSRQVRRILDEAGLKQTQILVSGDLDEQKVAALVGADTPIDAFGVGTRLSTSYDAPALGGVYKLVEETVSDGCSKGRMKQSHSKSTYPFAKQVWRSPDARHDVIGLASETLDGAPLLRRVMKNGMRTYAQEPLSRMRERAAEQIAVLPSEFRSLTEATQYDVRHSEALLAARSAVAAELGLPDPTG